MDISDEPPDKKPPTLQVAQRSLVVLAGLPGAGKSTLLERLHSASSVSVLDSEQVWRRMRVSLPSGVRYRWIRPVVHLVHRTRIAWQCAVQAHPVIAHEPATRASTRAMLVLFGWATGRERVMVWLEAEPAEARSGQRERGRLLKPESFRRHVRRAALVGWLLRSRRSLRGWNKAVVVRRQDVQHGLRLEIRR